MKITLEVQPSIPTTAAEFVAFIDELYGPFTQLVPLKDVDYIQTASTPLLTYDYMFKAQDNRKWDQVVDWPGGFSADPRVSLPTDSTTDRWAVAELQAHVVFRNTIFTLTRKFGITELHCKWVY